MAVIHHTTVNPTKVELLADWLPTRPWYRGRAGSPVLEKSGGFRLDDPEGEVGIEFMVATDTSGPEPIAYLVPLTYRGAPLEGDPVLVTGLLSLIAGRAQAMAQSISDTPDHEVACSYAGAPFSPYGFVPEPVDDQDGTRVPTPHGTILYVHRVLYPVLGHPPLRAEDAVGHVARGWSAPDGTEVAAVLMTLRTA